MSTATRSPSAKGSLPFLRTGMTFSARPPYRSGAVNRKPRASGATMFGDAQAAPMSSTRLLKTSLSWRNGMMSTKLTPSMGKSG